MDLSRTFFDFFSSLVRHHVRCSASYRHLHAAGFYPPLDRALRSRRRILETETFSAIWQTVSQRFHYRRRNRPETPSFEQLRAFRLATLRLVLHTNFFKASQPSLGDSEGTTASVVLGRRRSRCVSISLRGICRTSTAGTVARRGCEGVKATGDRKWRDLRLARCENGETPSASFFS